MANNPLQQYFRQPKIYIGLPSQGVYNKPGTIQGEPTHMPVFGMTGMDEILIKTPDALLSGETTVKVIQSCVPSITDAWDLSMLDLDLVLAAIRIATYGNLLTSRQICTKCSTDNEYEINLTTLIDHFTSCRYDNKLVLKDLTITTKPLTYRQATTFSLKNYQLQQQLAQVAAIESEEEKNEHLKNIFMELGAIQNEVYGLNVESVVAGNTVVTERAYIDEWLQNCDSDILDSIKTHIEKVQQEWLIPKYNVVCDNCGAESAISISLDNASFFAKA